MIFSMERGFLVSLGGTSRFSFYIFGVTFSRLVTKIGYPLLFCLLC